MIILLLLCGTRSVSFMLSTLAFHGVLRRVGVEQPDAVKAQRLQAAK